MSISFLGKSHIKTQQTAKWRSMIQPRDQVHYKDNSNGNLSEGPVAEMFIMKMWDTLICCAPAVPLLLLIILPHGQRHIWESKQPPLKLCCLFIWSPSSLTVFKAVDLFTPKKIYSGTHEPVLLQVGCSRFLPPEIISCSLCSHSGSYCLSMHSKAPECLAFKFDQGTETAANVKAYSCF